MDLSDELTNMQTTTLKTFEADSTEARLRLDRVLVAHLPDFTRNRLQSLTREGHVTVAGVTIIETSHRVNSGDTICLSIPEPVVARPQAEKILLDIVYEDTDLIVINKPAGMVVHPAPGNKSGTLVNALLAHCHETLSGIGGERRPGIVHRLDKDTSGLLVVAKNDFTHNGLAKQFAAHGRDGKLKRIYNALIWNVPNRPYGTINAPIGRSPTNHLKQTVLQRGGKEAITHFRVIKTFTDRNEKPIAALLTCQLETGRTHQIRVHMAHNKHPLLGDALYARGFESKAKCLSDTARNALQQLNRQALHAGHLSFVHPRNNQTCEFEQPVPNDLFLLINTMH